jgi:hypothetical protein
VPDFAALAARVAGGRRRARPHHPQAATRPGAAAGPQPAGTGGEAGQADRADLRHRPGRPPRPALGPHPRGDRLEVHDLNNTVKTLQATVDEPRSIRAPLKAGQRRRYAVIALGPGGRSEVSDGLDVPPTDKPGPTPEPTPDPLPGPTPGEVQFPGDIIGPNWYLTLPTGTQGSPDTVRMPKLATYSSAFFQLNDTRDGIIFRTWHGGVTTSGSPNPRSELREETANGPNTPSGNAGTGRHSMTVVGQVNRLTKVRPHVVLHQIPRRRRRRHRVAPRRHEALHH